MEFKRIRCSNLLLNKFLIFSKLQFAFKEPPYEYEFDKMPFDILAGDTRLRECLVRNGDLEKEASDWIDERASFISKFAQIALYPENVS